MDPKANLREQLEIAKRLVIQYANHSDDDIARLAELVLALDKWQRKGGFSPYAGYRRISFTPGRGMKSEGEK